MYDQSNPYATMEETLMNKHLEMIDWSKQYPNESALEIAIRQSTVCPCGNPKQIGAINCPSCKYGEGVL
jgi:hypothetical protein